VTTEYGHAEQQITETLMALRVADADRHAKGTSSGSEDVSRHAKFRETYKPEYIRFYKNFPVETHLRLMRSAACLVGNSASIREGVCRNTGRQHRQPPGRTSEANVIVSVRSVDRRPIRHQLKHARIARTCRRRARGVRIAEVLSQSRCACRKFALNVLGVIPAAARRHSRKNLALWRAARCLRTAEAARAAAPDASGEHRHEEVGDVATTRCQAFFRLRGLPVTRRVLDVHRPGRVAGTAGTLPAGCSCPADCLPRRISMRRSIC
jgi:hypothetical protein